MQKNVTMLSIKEIALMLDDKQRGSFTTSGNHLHSNTFSSSVKISCIPALRHRSHLVILESDCAWWLHKALEQETLVLWSAPKDHWLLRRQRKRKDQSQLCAGRYLCSSTNRKGI